MNDLRIKYLTKEQLIIAINRLTRFKHPEKKYLRVFYELILNYLISPKLKKSVIEEMDYVEIVNIVEQIINLSLEHNKLNLTGDYTINQKLLNYENNLYNIDENILTLLNNKIDYKAFIPLITDNSPNNLKWLKCLAFQNENLIDLRTKNKLGFPIEKVILVEGATEEILLPVLSDLYSYNFDENGVHLISAGGKNQVVKLYYELCETLKVPIFVLMDSDALENKKEILFKLRDKDYVYLIQSGEFEDVLPIDLIKRTLEYELSNISIIEQEMLNNSCSMVKNLEEIFRTRGKHEFKKVEFAQSVKYNISDVNDLSLEIKEIISKIKFL